MKKVRLLHETLYVNLKQSFPFIACLHRYVIQNPTSVKEHDVDFEGLVHCSEQSYRK